MLCVFGDKLGKVYVNLSFIPVFKPHTHKFDILRHCTIIVYISHKIKQLNAILKSIL
jgi:hypothetical protein